MEFQPPFVSFDRDAGGYVFMWFINVLSGVLPSFSIILPKLSFIVAPVCRVDVGVVLAIRTYPSLSPLSSTINLFPMATIVKWSSSRPYQFVEGV